MKKVFSLTAVFIFCLALPAFASEQKEKQSSRLKMALILWLPWGGQPDRATTPVYKNLHLYNSEDERQWSYTLRAVFTYDGISADAISAEARAAIYNREWRLTESDPHCQGAYAIADATFESPSDGSRSITMRLYCDGHGNIT